MKLSELKGERAVEAIADLIEPLTNIATNRNKWAKQNVKPVEGESKQEATARNLKEQLPVILRENKSDLLSIITIITGENAEEMSLPRIMKESIELLSDKDLGDLFLSVSAITARASHTESSEIATTSEPES